jgi:hypothetical protein
MEEESLELGHAGSRSFFRSANQMQQQVELAIWLQPKNEK